MGGGLDPGVAGTGVAATHEVLRALTARARARGRDGDSGPRIALAIEGGGMRGTVSAGMAFALHELGLVSGFDAVYGSSAGAISGAWLLSSNPDGLHGWTEPAYAKALINRFGPLRGRPVVDVRGLIEVLYQTAFPMDFESVLSNPIEFHPLATDIRTGEPTDLRPLIEGPADLRLALRASAGLPVLAGRPVTLGGRQFSDGGVSESVPYRTAIAQGATHVLVLRSRRDMVAAAGPSRTARLIVRTALRRQSAAFRAALLARDARLLAADERLAQHDIAPGDSTPAVFSIRPPADAPYVGRLARDGELLRVAFETGRAAVHAVFYAAGYQGSVP